MEGHPKNTYKIRRDQRFVLHIIYPFDEDGLSNGKLDQEEQQFFSTHQASKWVARGQKIGKLTVFPTVFKVCDQRRYHEFTIL